MIRFVISLIALYLWAMPSWAKKPLEVYVSVLPLQTLVQNIGGNAVVVHSMVRHDQSPATYTPLPSQMRDLANSALYFRVGVPFEQRWMGRIEAQHPDMKVVNLLDGLSLRNIENHTHEQDAGHNHESIDPHVWTDPLLTMQMSGVIEQELADLVPEAAASIHANAHLQRQALTQIHIQLQELLLPLQPRAFLVFHPSWGYFADRYGLQQIAIEHEGKMPNARHLSKLIDESKALGIKRLLLQPQFNRSMAQRLVEAVGATISVVDPLSANYPESLLLTGKALAGPQQ